MPKRRVAIILLVGALGLIGIAVGILLLTDTTLIPRRPSRPAMALTPPASLTELAERYPELSEILQDPELGSIYKEFLVAYQEGGEEAARTLAKERGLLTPDGESLRVMLVLDTEESAPLQQQLETLGVSVVSAYQDRVNISVPVALITEAMTSEETDDVFSRLTELQHVIAVRLPPQSKPDEQSIFGEGIPVINADAWHDAGFTGEGLHVGVLDLGFADYEALLGNELPAEVNVKTFGWYDDEEVHGTACAEIIHEVAPDARLSFAWYDGSDPAMGEAVEWLVDQGVDIISHSAGGVVSPRDGSGWDARLVDSLADQGVLWINSAGNEAASHYRGTFTDEDGDGYHEFAPGEELLALYNEGYLEVYLIWDDVWTAPIQDYELYIVNTDGETLAASEDTQDGSAGQRPAEWVQLQPQKREVYAVVMAYDNTVHAVTFDIFAHGPNVEIFDSVPGYSLGTPADARGALAVGAVGWNDDLVAFYSSQGPTNDGRLKPEISAPTGVSGATYGRYGFDGTSASAPHVAGAAALVWQAHPEFERAEVFDYLVASTLDLGPAGPDTAYGHGRLALPAPPAAIVATPTPSPPTVTPPPEATATAPPPTPTAVGFTTPTPTPKDDEEVIFGLTAIGLIIGGLGLGGIGLLIGGTLLLLVTRSSSTGAQRPAPPPPPSLAPPPPQSEPPRVAPPAPPPQPRPQPPAGPRCPTCGATLRPNSKFCATCGTPVVGSLDTTVKAKPAARYCRYCGATLRPNSKFCLKCGRKIA